MKRANLGGAVLLVLSTCAVAQPLTEVTIDGKTVKLEERAGQCVLSRGEQRVPLDMGWPCSLSPDRAGKARVERFNGVPIVLVIHEHPHSAVENECPKTARAVRLTQAGLEASMPARSTFCNSGFVDQKVFTGLFEW